MRYQPLLSLVEPFRHKLFKYINAKIALTSSEGQQPEMQDHLLLEFVNVWMAYHESIITWQQKERKIKGVPFFFHSVKFAWF